jgi:hypothetical protein
VSRATAGRARVDVAIAVVVALGILAVLVKGGVLGPGAARLVPYDLAATGAMAPAPLRPHELVLVRRGDAEPRVGQAVRIDVPGAGNTVQFGRIAAAGPDTLAVPPEASLVDGALIDTPSRAPRSARVLAAGSYLVFTTATDTTATRVGWVLGRAELRGHVVAVLLPPGHGRRLP